MKPLLLSLPFSLLLAACALPPPDDQGMQGSSAASSASSPAASSAVAMLDRLNDSPRHQEWADVRVGDKAIRTWVVYPQVRENRPVVLLIHENRGLTDWVRSLADQVAEAGYIAVAPDLLSDFSNQYARTSDFPDEDAAIDAIGQLESDRVLADLEAVTAWARTIPAAGEELAVAGFCWGGAQAFSLAAETDAVDATLVFYGTSPEDPAVYERIDAPVYGFYGGDDQRVNATIDRAQTAMADTGTPYQVMIYDGAGHAFMRLGEQEDASPANAAARDQAWDRMLQILQGL